MTQPIHIDTANKAFDRTNAIDASGCGPAVKRKIRRAKRAIGRSEDGLRGEKPLDYASTNAANALGLIATILPDLPAGAQRRSGRRALKAIDKLVVLASCRPSNSLKHRTNFLTVGCKPGQMVRRMVSMLLPGQSAEKRAAWIAAYKARNWNVCYICWRTGVNPGDYVGPHYANNHRFDLRDQPQHLRGVCFELLLSGITPWPWWCLDDDKDWYKQDWDTTADITCDVAEGIVDLIGGSCAALEIDEARRVYGDDGWSDWADSLVDSLHDVVGHLPFSSHNSGKDFYNNYAGRVRPFDHVMGQISGKHSLAEKKQWCKDMVKKWSPKRPVICAEHVGGNYNLTEAQGDAQGRELLKIAGIKGIGNGF